MWRLLTLRRRRRGMWRFFLCCGRGCFLRASMSRRRVYARRGGGLSISACAVNAGWSSRSKTCSGTRSLHTTCASFRMRGAPRLPWGTAVRLTRFLCIIGRWLPRRRRRSGGCSRSGDARADRLRIDQKSPAGCNAPAGQPCGHCFSSAVKSLVERICRYFTRCGAGCQAERRARCQFC